MDHPKEDPNKATIRPNKRNSGGSGSDTSKENRLSIVDRIKNSLSPVLKTKPDNQTDDEEADLSQLQNNPLPLTVVNLNTSSTVPVQEVQPVEL